MRIPVLLCVFSLLSLAACSGSETSTPTGTDTSSSSSSSSSSSGVMFTPAEGIDKVIVNEMYGIGSTEWVELASTYDKPVDLSGYGVADSKAMNGGPDFKNAIHFPEGTSIGPNDYIILSRNAVVEDPPVKHSGSTCVADAPSSSTCYYVDWEISNGMGEFIYIIDPAEKPIANFEYPAGTIDKDAGETGSYARIPDKTGNFTTTMTPTPGQPNK